jgi:thymidine phosphorylase
MVAALGGPADLVDAPAKHLHSASVTRPVAPERPGYVTVVDARAVGLVVTGLGGNRRREDDAIDYTVGLSDVAPIGAQVGPDRPLAIVHARGDSSAEEAAAALLAAVHVAPEEPAGRPVLLGRVG